MPWWIFLLIAIPYLFLWILVHEGSHALTTLFKGGKVLSFKPWPHRENGKFYWGRVTYQYWGDNGDSILATPYIVDTLAGLLFFLLAFIIPGGKWLFAFLLLGPIIDLGNAIRLFVQGREEADLSQIDSPLTVCNLILMLAWLAISLLTIILFI